MHGPLWQPSPQCAEVLPQKPYMEQQLPCGQFPQVVPPFAAPHVPSVVTPPVAAELLTDVVGDPMTGSLLLAPPLAGVLGADVGEAAEADAGEDGPALDEVTVQPL